MSVLIRGMEMPTSPVLFCIHPDGKVFADLEGGWKEYNAVPVPPHGRMIDADALKRKQLEDADIFKDAYTLMEKSRRDEALNAVANIVNAPTIIPAEEE